MAEELERLVAVPAATHPIGSIVSVGQENCEVLSHPSMYGLGVAYRGEATFVGTEGVGPPHEGQAASQLRPRPAVSGRVVEGTGDSAAGRLRSPRPPARASAGGACVVVGWRESAPRTAIHWERLPDGSVLVRLRSGYQYSDGATERTFRTVRQAKDETRAASQQGSLL